MKIVYSETEKYKILFDTDTKLFYVEISGIIHLSKSFKYASDAIDFAHDETSVKG